MGAKKWVTEGWNRVYAREKLKVALTGENDKKQSVKTYDALIIYHVLWIPLTQIRTKSKNKKKQD